MVTEGKLSWVIKSVDALRDVGSWTGESHVMLLLFVVARDIFEFQFSYQWPHCGELKQIENDLIADGCLEVVYEKAGCAYRLKTTALGREQYNELSNTNLTKVELAAEAIGKQSTQDLKPAVKLLMQTHQNFAE